MKKIIFGLIFVLIALIGVAGVSASEISNCSLETNFNENSIENVCVYNQENGFISIDVPLQTQVDKTPENSTLDLKDNFVNIEQSVKINKNLTIDGNGHSINCSNNSKCSIFESNCGHITLKNLKLTNCKDSAISISGTAKLTVDNCTFMNNYGNIGGAIKNTAGTVLNIKNSHFESNEAGNCGGAIYTTGKINMENTKVISNTAAIAGGISTRSDAYLFNCELSNNSAKQLSGGALVSKGHVTLDSTFVSKNTANVYGGGVCCTKNVHIKNSTITGNHASTGGGIWAGNSVIFDESPNAQSTVAYNTACYGGGIYFDGAIWLGYVDFYCNYAEYEGNAVCGANPRYVTGSDICIGRCVRSLIMTKVGLLVVSSYSEDFIWLNNLRGEP